MNVGRIFASLAVVYGGTLLLLFTFQRNILYLPPAEYVPPQSTQASPKLTELTVTTDDGLTLKGWYAPATRKSLTLVFFHGNAASLETMATIPSPYINAGYGFLSTEYRGYSSMPGHPTEKGLYSDGRAFLRSLIAAGVPENEIVLFGHSLGTGVAVQMAKEFHVHGLILLAPYLSIPKMAQIRFPIFPAEYLAKDRYDNFLKIPNLHIPIMIANGGQDTVIPPSHGKQLFELAHEPKHYVFIPEAGHNDLFDSEVLEESLKWLKELETVTVPANE